MPGRPSLRALLFFIGLALSRPLFANAATANLSGLIVDKKTNSLSLVSFSQLTFSILKTYHATLGLIPGDKETEGDKKTPEGIYFFDELLRPPRLQKKFGSMALTMNYPNPWDRFMKRTGSGIWLHATDEPQRLSKDFDSLGCVVVKDEEIEELLPKLTYRTSPILVYDDFEKQRALTTPGRLASLEAIVKNWAHSWAGKDLDAYVSFYHPGFTTQGKDLGQWRDYKAQLNRQYATISVRIDHLFVFAHPKYDVAMFHQEYVAKHKNGAIAKRSAGVKILYLSREGGDPKILSEEFRHARL